MTQFTAPIILAAGFRRIQQRDHGHLVGNRAVEPLPVHGPGTLHGVSQGFGFDLDGQVAPVHSDLGKRGFDHRLGRVFGDRVTKDTDKLLPEAGAGFHGVVSADFGKAWLQIGWVASSA